MQKANYTITIGWNRLFKQVVTWVLNKSSMYWSNLRIDG